MGGENGRLKLMKEAAIDVITSLTIADFFTVITFSDAATTLTPTGNLMQATAENKDQMIAAIENLTNRGGTEYYLGFQEVFETLQKSRDDESTSERSEGVKLIKNKTRK